MSRLYWTKCGLIVAGATVAVLTLGGCLSDFLLQQFVNNFAQR